MRPIPLGGRAAGCDVHSTNLFFLDWNAKKKNKNRDVMREEKKKKKKSKNPSTLRVRVSSARRRDATNANDRAIQCVEEVLCEVTMIVGVLKVRYTRAHTDARTQRTCTTSSGARRDAHAEHRLSRVERQNRLVSSPFATPPPAPEVVLAWLGQGKKYVDCTSDGTHARSLGRATCSMDTREVEGGGIGVRDERVKAVRFDSRGIFFPPPTSSSLHSTTQSERCFLFFVAGWGFFLFVYHA